MASGLEIYQGEKRDLPVLHGIAALASATEIEYTINSDPKITKTLTGGDISGVTATAMTISLETGDTSDLTLPGGSEEYRQQIRYTTVSGQILHVRVSPQLVRIRQSDFV